MTVQASASLPHIAVTNRTDPVVQRLRRLGDNQESDGSTPSGIIVDSREPKSRAHGPTGRHQLGMLEIRVQLPVSPLTVLRKVAGYGWPGRSAKAVLARRDEGSNPLPSAY